MRHVKRSVLVPHSAAQMFRLVDDVESYPEFLPWCNDATVDRRDGDVIEATLELHKGAISRHFRHQFDAIYLELVGGPFRHLEGGWRFQALADNGCKVSLELEFEFENALIDMMFGRYFEDTCNSLVDAFTQRAADVYGN